MSFGESPSDIIIVVAFCRELYRKCRAAGGEYDEISREVRGLHTVLKHLKSAVKDGDSPLNRNRSIWVRQLAPIIWDCDFTLKQLNGLLLEYGRLFEGSGVENGSSKISWDKKRFGSNEMDRLGAIRVKLISHKTSLTVFLDTIQLQENGKMKMGLNVQGEQLDIILDKVDHIAAKMSHRGGPFMTSSENGDKEVWKQFRRGLILEGFSSDVLQQHKDVLRAYIRQMEQDGLLVGEPPTPQMRSPVSPHTERWINLTHSESSHVQPLPFNSIGSDDSGAKEMIQREDNVERLKPEPHLDPWFEGQPERQSTPIRRQLSPPLTPKMSAAHLTKPEWQEDTSGSESDTSSIHRHQTKSPPNIIQTSDLSLLPFLATPQLLPPPAPSAYHSQSHPNEATRSMALRPNRSSDRASSLRTRRVRFDLSDRQPSPKINTPVTETSPRHDSTIPMARLAPDSYGNEIPPDAKWTKVKRSLISSEVLNQDGRRYEARPEFVAILGILTKDEIQNYASRSYTLREERWRKHHQASIGPEERSTKEKLSGTRRRRNSSSSKSSFGGNSTSDSDSDSGWNSDSESESSSNSDSKSDSDSASDSDSDSDDDSRRNKRKGQDERESKMHNREDLRERGERGDGEDRAERRECMERNERDRESSYTFSPTSATYPSSPQNQPQPFSNLPDTVPINTPSLSSISGLNQSLHGYAPPPIPFPPQQAYPQQPIYAIRNQQPYAQGPPYPDQFLSPHLYADSPHSSFSSIPTYPPSQSPSFRPFSPSSNKPYNPEYTPRRRSHHHSHSHHSRNRDHNTHRSRNRDRDRDASGSTFGRAPMTGSGWRDHLAVAGIGGAALGFLTMLSETADGF
ncbi:hypothetical protein OCU04_002345 [Sclerotinia nivalis]|uniref:DUF8035 domain-containing protein n=1 Tax=Sclerotinia nivalis TaxID=352851 RepID=A0A9X0DQ29_9HELO|nr:hypothetical protein OCU04_002345 [Sclerotinia nivalis]